jgi:hypothetical protein
MGLLASHNLILKNFLILSSRFMLNTPLLGLTLKWWGAEGVNPSNLKRLFEAGQNCSIVPGGFEEGKFYKLKFFSYI